MATTNLTIRMDSELKEQVKELAEDLGMDMTTFFTVYAKKAVRTWKIPFEISGDIPNEETLKAFEEVEKMKKDPSYGKTYTDVDQMMREILDEV